MTPDPDPAVDPGLARIGWRDADSVAFAEIAGPGDRPARVARVDRGAATVWPGPQLETRVPFAPGLDDDGRPAPATGDWVVLGAGPDGTEMLRAILPRRSAFVRGDPTYEGRDQVVATNIDLVLLVHGLGQAPNLRRLERELVLAWESGAVPVVVLNKADLSDDPGAALAAVSDIAPGVDVVVVSCVDGRGLDALAERLRDRSITMIGPSGVGKSTLVNRLLGEVVQATAEVRGLDQKGRHTTTARELLALPGGGLVIDTPGMRAVALAETEEGLGRAFPDLEAFAAACRFRDCAHRSEPGCAVRAAVAAGELESARVDSYLRLQEELDSLAARQAEGRARAEARAAERARGRAFKATPKRSR